MIYDMFVEISQIYWIIVNVLDVDVCILNIVNILFFIIASILKFMHEFTVYTRSRRLGQLQAMYPR